MNTQLRIYEAGSPFLVSSSVGNWPIRLRLRHRAIIEHNADVFRGAAVLDIASHDGRWSFAALQAGAAHVTGLEARDEHVEKARDNFEQLGVPPERYEFNAGDVFARGDILARGYDVVLCLGFFYHTARHLELLSLIADGRPRVLILDTAVSPLPGPAIELLWESSSRPGNAVTGSSGRAGEALVAHPSGEALDMMLESVGFAGRAFDWPALLAQHGLPKTAPKGLTAENPMGDYIRGERMTIAANLNV